MHNFKELNIWQKSIDLVEEVYSLTKNLPDSEKFGLVSQLNRSSVSISSNIAEGSGRNSNKDFVRFLNIALGSSYELETQLILVNRLFKNHETKNIIEQLNEIQKMIRGFAKSLV